MARPKPIYPVGWKEFSRYIRFDVAQGRCQCTGECGLHKTHPGPRRCVERDATPAQWARGMVVLTVAHLCHCDPLCAEESHVKACCQRCHLRIDIPLHRQHMAETRRQALEAQGQLTFLVIQDERTKGHAWTRHKAQSPSPIQAHNSGN